MLPLAGVRILDCTQWNAGPLAMRLLADFGADVVKVESIQHVDPLRNLGASIVGPDDPLFYEHSWEWNYVNRNKSGITLDLRSDRGREIFLRLVGEADIVAENLRPGSWEGFGLGYDRLREVNPRVIFVSMPGFGQGGPWSGRSSWAMTIDQMAGITSQTGYANGPPMSHALWADYANGMHVAFALIGLLRTRGQTGVGQQVDVSQLEVVTAMNAEALLDYQMNGRTWRPVGNRDRRGRIVPRGCFRCAGEDAWVAIAVQHDEQWQSFAAILAEDGVDVGEDRYRTAVGRREYEDELESRISAWTSTRERHSVANRLQEAGVPASPVMTPDDFAAEPDYVSHGLLERVTRPPAGARVQVGAPFKYRRTPLTTRKVAPRLGEDNREVLTDRAGVPVTELAVLETNAVIGTTPAGHRTGSK